MHAELEVGVDSGSSLEVVDPSFTECLLIMQPIIQCVYSPSLSEREGSHANFDTMLVSEPASNALQLD